jgi:hypothetical protein
MGDHEMRYIVAFLVILFAGLSARAQEQFIYPAKGQSAQQQEKDRFECYGWAKSNSGFDPMAVPRTQTRAPSGGGASVGGSAIRGAAGGAAVGAAAGAIAGGKAGKGAAIGAAGGGMLSGMGAAGQNRRASDDRRQWEQREASTYAANRDKYDRAFAACMSGRGYTVN